MARLTCVYCNNVISRSDTKCPYCGAETESSIKKFTAVREADIENNKTLLAAVNKRRRKQVSSLVCATLALVILSVLLFKFVTPSTAKTILFVVLVLAYAVCLGVGIKGIRKNSAERRELNARLDGLSHDIIFDCEEVEPYKMINDVKSMPNEGCFKEGLQQIAFKVSITNGSANKRSVWKTANWSRSLGITKKAIRSLSRPCIKMAFKKLCSGRMTRSAAGSRFM